MALFKRKDDYPAGEASTDAGVVASPEPVVDKVTDPFDKKLDYFEYTKDPNALDDWEYQEGVNPLTLPRDIRESYPNLRFRWVSEYNLRTKGENYHGWQLFKDGKRPEGVRRGNDLRLAAMPEERAQRYNDEMAYRSTANVKGLQERQIRNVVEAEKIPGVSALRVEGEVGGVSIGPGRSGQQRGYSREEVREMIIKAREERAKGRKSYSFLGGIPKPGG